MAKQNKPAVPLTGLNSHRTTSGIFYESDEVELMKEIGSFRSLDQSQRNGEEFWCETTFGVILRS